MKRVYWTVDLLEAHIVAGLLCEEDVRAWVFDAGMVRQNWFQAIAIGGYRVVVEPADVPRALTIVARYQSSGPDLAYAEGEMPTCPKCPDSAVTDDPRPRRAAFVAAIVLYPLVFAAYALSVRANLAPMLRSALIVVSFCSILAFYWPGVLGFIVKHRYVCKRCACRFRDVGGAAFDELSAAVARAEASQRGA